MRLLEESQMRWVSGGTFSAGDDERSPGGQPPRDPDEPSPVPRQEEEPPRGIVDTLPERICDSGQVDRVSLVLVEPERQASLGKLGKIKALEAAEGESTVVLEIECNNDKEEKED